MIDLVTALGFLAFHLINLLPGIAAARMMARRGWLSGWATTLVVGYALGYAWEILAGILLMNQDLPVWILPAVSLLAVTILWLARSGRFRTGESLGGFLAEYRSVWLVAGMAILLTSVVILRVGRLDGDYHVFTTLFVNDYFNHMAVTAELAKNVPPSNIYFHGPTAHYYWFFHSVPAMFHRLVDLQSNVRHLLLVIDAVNLVAFFLSLAVVLRAAGASRRAASWSLTLVLAGYSYMNVFVLGRELGHLVNITEKAPALSSIWARLDSFSGLSHSFLRDFWVEPHGVAALIFLFTAVVVYRASDRMMPTFARGLVAGLLVLSAFGCDSFLGFILALWIGLTTLMALIRTRFIDRNQWLFIGGVGVVAIVGAAYVFGFNMIGGQSGLLSVTPFVAIIATLPFYLALDYGPIFLLGLLGWLLLWRRKATGAAPQFHSLAMMALIALVLGLFLRHAIEYDILLRKSGKPLQLVLLVGAGWAFDWLATHRRWLKYAVVAVLLALPTAALDLQAFGGFFGSRGLENRIAHADMVALDWIRNNTPPDAVVQGQPGYAGDYLYDINPIPAIAERPVYVCTYMLAALWGVGGEAAMKRIRQVDSLLSDPKLVRTRQALPVDYWFLGTREQKSYIKNNRRWSADNSGEIVYDSLGVLVIKNSPDDRPNEDTP